MSNVADIGLHSGNGKMTSPINCLKDVIKCIEDGDISPNKILVITLNSKDDTYATSWHQAGMKMSDCLALIEVAKVRFLQEMEYIPNE